MLLFRHSVGGTYCPQREIYSTETEYVIFFLLSPIPLLTLYIFYKCKWIPNLGSMLHQKWRPSAIQMLVLVDLYWPELEHCYFVNGFWHLHFTHFHQRKLAMRIIFYICLCYRACVFLRNSLFLGKIGQKEDCICFWKNKVYRHICWGVVSLETLCENDLFTIGQLRSSHACCDSLRGCSGRGVGSGGKGGGVGEWWRAGNIFKLFI